MHGKKLTSLVIGKSDKPRCFKNVKIIDLSEDYNLNGNEWMASIIFKNSY